MIYNKNIQQRAREQSENVYESPTMFDFCKTSMIQSLHLIGLPYKHLMEM